MNLPKLAPHDADLIETDAERLYEEVADAESLSTSWGELPESTKALYRLVARNPVALVGRPGDRL